MDTTGAIVGSVSVHTSSHGGHSAEFHAERLVKRLINVSKDAPEPIRAQALHYQHIMHVLVLEALKAAMASERSTVLAELNRSSFSLVKKG